jgi:hypothetical protein
MNAAWTHDYTLVIPAPAARLFQALTTSGDLERWFAERARVEPRVGGAFRFWGRHTVGTRRVHPHRGLQRLPVRLGPLHVRVGQGGRATHGIAAGPIPGAPSLPAGAAVDSVTPRTTMW